MTAVAVILATLATVAYFHRLDTRDPDAIQRRFLSWRWWR